MSEHSGIDWTEATWNPVTGCTPTSAGCRNCYARDWAELWRGKAGNAYEHGFDLQLRPERLDLPGKWRRPKWVFINSMGDLWHEGVPDGFIDRVMRTVAETPRHSYQALTKRAERMRRWAEGKELPANLWLGVTVEDQANYWRIHELAKVKHAKKWVSHEPLIGRITHERVAEDTLSWVVVGGETGRTARPMHPEWERELRQWSAKHGKPYFFKQWGEYDSEGRKVGKKQAGKLVEGQLRVAMPA